MPASTRAPRSRRRASRQEVRRQPDWSPPTPPETQGSREGRACLSAVDQRSRPTLAGIAERPKPPAVAGRHGHLDRMFDVMLPAHGLHPIDHPLDRGVVVEPKGEREKEHHLRVRRALDVREERGVDVGGSRSSSPRRCSGHLKPFVRAAAGGPQFWSRPGLAVADPAGGAASAATGTPARGGGIRTCGSPCSAWSCTRRSPRCSSQSADPIRASSRAMTATSSAGTSGWSMGR